MENAKEFREGHRASVVMMRGSGEQRIRQAIMQGLVRKEIEQDVKDLLTQIDDERSKLEAEVQRREALEYSYQAANRRLSEYERIYHDAIEAYKREEARKKKRNDAMEMGIIIGALFLIVLFSTIVSNFILG